MGRLVVDQIEGRSGNANTITIPTGHTLLSPGGIVQVVHNTVTSTATYATGSGADNVSTTGLTCTITPKSSSSIIIVQFNCTLGTSSYQTKLLLGRTINGGGNVWIGRGDAEGGRPQATSVGNFYDNSVQSYKYIPISNTIKDAPSTTDEIVYTLYMGAYNGQTVYLNRSQTWQNSNVNGYDAVPSSNMIVWEVVQ